VKLRKSTYVGAIIQSLPKPQNGGIEDAPLKPSFSRSPDVLRAEERGLIQIGEFLGVSSEK